MKTDDRHPERALARVARRLAYGLSVAAMLGLLASTGAAAADAADPERAKKLITEVCASCHGVDGNSTAPTFPKLAGLHPEYIARVLKEFATGKRHSETMAPMVALIDPADYRAIGDYFGTLKPSQGKVQDPKLAELGKKLYDDGDEERGVPSCAGCHDVDAKGSKRYPRLASQHREYLVQEMYNFQKGVRNYDAARVMREVAKRLSDDEIKAVAEYLSGL